MLLMSFVFLVAPLLRSADHPLKATNVAAHVLQYRKDLPDGWRPVYKAVVDTTLQNTTQSVIDTADLCLDFVSDPELPGQDVCGRGDEKFTVTLKPGNSKKVGWSKIFTFEGDPATGSFTDAGKSIVVSLVSLKYANGFLAYFGPPRVVIGQGVFPSSTMFPKVSGCEAAVDFTDEMSEPRVIDAGASDGAWNYGITVSSSETVTFQVVIDSNGSVCDASILKGNRGKEADLRRSESLKKSVWFPAIQNGVPIAVRFVHSWVVQHTVTRFN
jgi:hypothetical protein